MRSTERAPRASDALLRIEALDVYYGQAHALQGVSLALDAGVLAVVGRNGMGKSTLCKAVTGLVPAAGSIRFAGQELLGRAPDQITRLGVGYVPQGRRVWRSLTVDETLQLAARTARQGAWTVERIYEVFPRLAQRRGNGGAQLSGGEQQMLAIGRALLFNPRLLVMDEPTEGLAPVIVEQVVSLLKSLAAERSMAVLLIEQNLGVALELADQVAVMVNGRIAHCLPAGELAADRALQQRLLGLRAGAADHSSDPDAEAATGVEAATTVLRVVRAHGPATGIPDAVTLSPEALPDFVPAAPEEHEVDGDADVAPPQPGLAPSVVLAGAWSTQQRELLQARRSLEAQGLRVVTVELAGGTFSTAQVGARDLLRHHPDAAFFSRYAGGPAPQEELALALGRYLAGRVDVAGLFALTQEATRATAAAAVRALPVGVPKLLVGETAASRLPGVLALALPAAAAAGDVEALLSQAATALAGMVRGACAPHASSASPRTTGDSRVAGRPLFH